MMFVLPDAFGPEKIVSSPISWTSKRPCDLKSTNDMSVMLSVEILLGVEINVWICAYSLTGIIK